MVEVLKAEHADIASTPVVGYSLAYPGGVLGAILVAAVGAKLLRVDHIQDARDEGIIQSHLEWRVVEVTQEALSKLTEDGRTITVQQVPQLTDANIVVTRYIASTEGATEQLAYPDAPVVPKMRMVINGTLEELEKPRLLWANVCELMWKRTTSPMVESLFRIPLSLDAQSRTSIHCATVSSSHVYAVVTASTLLKATRYWSFPTVYV